MLDDVECDRSQPCYFVIAHDGDNSSGRAGSEETWNNSSDVTYSDPKVEALGVDEYLRQYPIKDFIHIQDGSWIDTRDSSADPSWYHWHLPFGVWEGQRHSFNQEHAGQISKKLIGMGVIFNTKSISSEAITTLKGTLHFYKRLLIMQRHRKKFFSRASKTLDANYSRRSVDKFFS